MSSRIEELEHETGLFVLGEHPEHCDECTLRARQNACPHPAEAEDRIELWQMAGCVRILVHCTACGLSLTTDREGLIGD